MRKLNPKSAGGPDGFHPIFLKNCNESLSQPLAYLFSLSYAHSFLPPSWRHAYITPIFKKGDPSCATNYRPISLTSTACKLMESIIKDILCSSLLAAGRITKQQHAFIIKHSTTTNLLESTYDWTISLNNRTPVDVLYIDFSKAFDSVVHSKLTHKLRQIGLPDLLISWITAFLTDRSQQVRIENVISHMSKVTSGVPQGSVLGPILFIIYVNDLEDVLSNKATFKLFADDLKLYSSFNIPSSYVNLQHALDLLVLWSTSWQLPINQSKTQLLHLGPSQKCAFLSY